MVIRGSLDHFGSYSRQMQEIAWRVERAQMSSLKTKLFLKYWGHRPCIHFLTCSSRLSKTWPLHSFHRRVTTRWFNYNSSNALLAEFLEFQYLLPHNTPRVRNSKILKYFDWNWESLLCYDQIAMDTLTFSWGGRRCPSCWTGERVRLSAFPPQEMHIGSLIE